jgi:hypothetical protein
MKRRTAGFLIGILAVVCFGLLASVVYPFTTVDSHAATPPAERFTTGDSDAFRASGRLVVDGDVRLAFEGIVTADGAWYQRVVDENVISESYQPAPNATVYHRLQIQGSDAIERRRELITENPDTELVSADQEGDRVTFLVEENGTGVTQPVSGTASVFVNTLSIAGYEADGTESSTGSAYEPRSGWYEGREPYRLTDASGVVHADADTHVVSSANVSWDVTTPAGTYAEYVLVRSTTDEPTTYRTTFEFDSGDSDIERPAWVGDVTSTEHRRTDVRRVDVGPFRDAHYS